MHAESAGGYTSWPNIIYGLSSHQALVLQARCFQLWDKYEPSPGTLKEML